MSLLLAAAATVALGVGASSSTEVIVKINGKDTVVSVAGAPAGNQASKQFLQCLVARRVLRVSGHKVTMLDGTSVADHLKEFATSQTTADACELGKAAYTPTTPPLAGQQTAAAAPAAAPAGKAKPKHEAHISFATGTPVALPSPASQTGGAQQPAAGQPASQQRPVIPTTQAPANPNAPVVIQGSNPSYAAGTNPSATAPTTVPSSSATNTEPTTVQPTAPVVVPPKNPPM